MSIEHLHALTAAMTSWTRAEDPLLGSMTEIAAEDDVTVLEAPNGRAAAAARVVHTPTTESRSLWVASTADLLQLRVADDATSDDVADVLDQWLAGPPATIADPAGEHAWSLRIPVVARQAIVPLLERGFAPTTSTMVRATRERDAMVSADPDDVRVRPARSRDREALVALMRELIATERQLGATRVRAEGLGDHHADDAIAHGEGWSLVAEVDDRIVGWMSLSPFADSAWAAPSTSAERVAYLGVASVTHASRSRGVGRALAHRIHRHAAREGATATLLDASTSNPWSIPFWHRAGYRPLHTTWQRRSGS